MRCAFDGVEDASRDSKEKKEEDVLPSGEDSEIYRKTIEKMLHSKDVSPLMKKVLEKEMKQAKVSASDEEALLHQADKAIQDLESGLKDGSIPSFLKPFAEGVLPKMRSIRDRAYRMAEKGEGASSEAAGEARASGSSGKEQEKVVKSFEEKSSADKSSTEKSSTDKTSTKASSAEKSTTNKSTDKSTDKSTTDKPKDHASEEAGTPPPSGSEFMNSLNRKSPEHNDFFVAASHFPHP